MIPTITIARNARGDYAIQGFEDFDRHARHNLPLYRALVNSTTGMSEVDRLRVMLWHYVNEAETAKALYYKAVENGAAPIIGANGEVYRYVGP